MVLSYYLWKIPYSIIWEIKNFIKKNEDVVFYCADELDWIVFQNVYQHLQKVKIVAKNRAVQRDLKNLGVDASLLPSFPKTVIMARHALHKFPHHTIKKIGMRHGPYHFKTMIDKSKYNAFDLFLFTSKFELVQAQELGIKCGASGGYPKLDNAFNNTYNDSELKQLKKKIGLDLSKKTILFTATWERSGMSAIRKWADKINSLHDDYNVLITLHPFIKNRYEFKECFEIKEKNVLPYMLMSDVIIGDTSSILAEACALNKAIITFRINKATRLNDEIKKLISEISIQINDFSEIQAAISELQRKPDLLYQSQEKWNAIMFDELNGNNGEIAAKLIKQYLDSWM